MRLSASRSPISSSPSLSRTTRKRVAMSSAERQVEHQVERRGAPLGGQPVERDADEVVVGVRLLDARLRPPVAPGLEGGGAGPVPPRGVAVEGGPLVAGQGQHLLPLVDLGQRHGVGNADLHHDRAARDLRVHLAGQRRAPLDRAQRGAGLVGPGHERGPGDRDAVAHRQLGELVDEQAGPDRHLEDALAQLAEHRGERVHLVDLGEAARHRSAERALVGGLARRREPDRAGLHGLAHEAGAWRSTSSGGRRPARRRRARTAAAACGR